MVSDTGPALLDVADDSPETIQDLYEARGWGDGLPLVPPTPARVEAMLAALAGLGAANPAESIAPLPPRFGQATRRLIAINAVLAGCRPHPLPVLVTAVRALA